MKRIISVLLVFVILLGACGNNETEKSKESVGTKNTETTDANDKKNTESNEAKETVNSTSFMDMPIEELVSKLENLELSKEDDFVVKEVNGKDVIVDYVGSEEAIFIPDTINGKKVEAVYDNVVACSGDKEFYAVKLSDGIKEVVFDEAGATKIGITRAFISGDGLEVLGKGVFQNAKVEYIHLGKAVNTLASGSILGARELKKLIIDSKEITNYDLEAIGKISAEIIVPKGFKPMDEMKLSLGKDSQAKIIEK